MVARLYPAKAILATVCPHKGVDEQVVARMASFIKDSGYRSIVYRSDQEPSIRAMFEEAFKASGREGALYNADLHQMVPEASAVGESQSNGKAESSVQKIEDLLRTYKSALETNIGTRIPVDHPVFAWMVEHAASIHNRLICTEDGNTPYQSLHGQRYRGKLVEFGEQVFYFIPKALRSKMSLRWRVGTFLGNAMSTNEAYVGSSAGEVIRTRSVVRVMEPSRWSSAAVLGVKGTPFHLRPSSKSDSDAHVEEFVDPHANKDDSALKDDGQSLKFDSSDVKKLDRSIRITAKDLEYFGYSDNCPRCADLQAGISNSAKHHTDECRLRMYLCYRTSDHPK